MDKVFVLKNDEKKFRKKSKCMWINSCNQISVCTFVQIQREPLMSNKKGSIVNMTSMMLIVNNIQRNINYIKNIL